MMCYEQRKIYIISAMYALSLLLIPFIPNKTASNLLFAALTVLGAVIGTLFIKKRRVPDLGRRDVMLVTGVTAALAVMTICLLGLHFGFYKNSLSANTFYTYIIPITVAVIAEELFRYALLSQKQKSVRILSYFLFVLADIVLFSEKNTFRSVSSFMSLLGMVFLPAFISNLLYYKLSFKYGAYSVMPYRLVILLYSYLLPFRAAVPRAMLAFAKIVFPLLVLWIVKMLFDKRVMIASRRRGPLYTSLTVFCVVMMFLGVAFVANLFPVRPIVVASNSMKEEMSRGDVAVYKVYDGQPIQNGQVILFKRNNSIIIHRVVDIKKINGVYRYYTKGDANEGMDTGYITSEDIVGTTTMKIKYIGYPTVWLYDIFKK